jgi:hypothetical protein
MGPRKSDCEVEKRKKERLELFATVPIGNIESVFEGRHGRAGTHSPPFPQDVSTVTFGLGAVCQGDAGPRLLPEKVLDSGEKKVSLARCRKLNAPDDLSALEGC